MLRNRRKVQQAITDFLWGGNKVTRTFTAQLYGFVSICSDSFRFVKEQQIISLDI